MNETYTILGDLHIGKSIAIGKPGPPGALNSRVQDQVDLLDWTLAKALENDSKTIIVTGDIFEETRPHPTLIRLFMLWLKRCEKAKVTVHKLRGNHDIVKTGSYTVSALDIVPAIELPYAHVYENVKTIDFGDITFTMLPYRDRKMYDAKSPEEALVLLKKELEQAKPLANTLNILIGHLALEGSLFVGDEVDDMLNEIFCPLDMFNDFDYVWMGHIHKPQVLKESKPRLAHIGSMDRSDFGKAEMDQDKILVLVNPSWPEVFREIVIPTRPLRKIEISVPEDKDTTDFVINEIFGLEKNQPLKDAIVKVEIQLEGPTVSNVDRDKLAKFLYSKVNVHHITNISESRILQPIKADEASVFDRDITTATAINSFTDTMKLDAEDDRAKVKEFCMECYGELK